MGDNPNVKSGDSPDGDLTRVRKPGTVVSKTTTTEFIPAKDGNHPGSSKDQQMLSVEKTVTVRNEEVLMVNGTPMSLEGAEGEEIKACLIQVWLALK